MPGIRTVEVIEEILHGSAGKTVLILVGKGNNGGDGLVIARHLMNAGAQVLVFAPVRTGGIAAGCQDQL